MRQQAIICLLLVVIVYCVNKCAGHGGAGWAKSYSSSSASSSASSYSSSFYSGDPSELKNFKPPVATAFATANAQAGIGGASAGAKASASSGANANSGSSAKSDAHTETHSNSQLTDSENSGALTGTGATAGMNSQLLTGGVADVHQKDETGTQVASDGAIITNAIAGAYAPSQVKGNQVKSSSGSKHGYYSNDFVLPSRDTDTDYDTSEESATHGGSHTNQKSTTASVSGATSSASSETSGAHTKTTSIPFKSAFGQDLSGSITTNTHLKSPLSPTKKYSFPGPSGSIYDYKPAPPGGGGPDKAWLVTPITTVSQKGAQASSFASSNAGTVGLTHNLISSFPGSPGSIYDSKPVHAAAPPSAPATGCSGNACSYPSQSHGASSVYPSPSIQAGCTGTYCSNVPVNKPTLIPGSGCTSGTSCGSQTLPTGSSTSSGLNSVLGILPGSSGSIYDSKPVPSGSAGCQSGQCTGQSTSGSYKPITQVTSSSNVYGHSGLAGGSTNIHDSKPTTTTSGSTGCINGQCNDGSYKPIVTPSNTGFIHPEVPSSVSVGSEDKPVSTGSAGCFNNQCNGQLPSGSYKPISQSVSLPNVGVSYPSGSIYDSRPVNGVSSAGSNAQSNSGSIQGSYQSGYTGNAHNVLSDTSGSYHNNKPITSSDTAGNVTPGQSSSHVNPGLANIIQTLPGKQESIYTSKPTSSVTANSNTYANANANANTATLTGGPCSGSSCTYPDNSIKKPSYGTAGCSGSACSTRPIYSSKPFIPVGIISDGSYTTKPSFGIHNCKGSSCSNNVIGNGCSGSSCGGYNAVKPTTVLAPPAIGAVPSPVHECLGSSCAGGAVTTGQAISMGSNPSSASQTSIGTESAKESSSHTGYISQPSPPCSPGSIGCTKPIAGNQLYSNGNGVIAGPGTGNLPVDETSSGSYLGLAIPADTDNVKPVNEPSQDVKQPASCSGASCSTYPVGTSSGNQLYTSGSSGVNGATVSSSGSNSGTYQSGSYGNTQPVSGCSSGLCGSALSGQSALSGAGSLSNNANGYGTGSVVVQGNDGLIFPGPDNSNTYGTEKPGIACTGGNCGSYISNAGAIASSGSRYEVPKTNCANGRCASSEGNAGSGEATFGFGGNFDKAGSIGNSGSYASAVSSASSGVDLGPLAHFFGPKGVANAGAFANAGSTANSAANVNAGASAGSFSSSGSFAKSGSFASSYSSSSAGSY